MNLNYMSQHIYVLLISNYLFHESSCMDAYIYISHILSLNYFICSYFGTEFVLCKSTLIHIS